MRVLVLGGGYAGLTLTRDLEDRLDDEHDLVLVDDDGTHLVQHELHRVVRRPALADEISIDLEAVLDRATVREATVDSVDTDDRTVHLADGDALDYDVCAVCLGAEAAMGVSGLREHATPLKRIEHARAIHEEAASVLESAGGPTSNDSARIVVGGAGLSGVQVAGELAALADAHDRTVGEDVEVLVLEQLDDVAPGFDRAFQAAIHGALEERGVAVRTRTRAERVTADAIEVVDASGTAGAAGATETVAYDQLVWTGGVVGPGALGGERPQVDARLLIADRTFGLGDAVRVVDREGQAVPATAQAAVREASVVAANVERLVEGGDGVFEPRLDRFTFDSPGWVVSVGDGAVAKVGPTVLTGRAAVALKATVGVGYLSSVGALREAVDLVNQELGLPVGEDRS